MAAEDELENDVLSIFTFNKEPDMKNIKSPITLARNGKTAEIFRSTRFLTAKPGAAALILLLVLALQAAFFIGAAAAGAAGTDSAGGTMVSQEAAAETGRRLPANLIITVKAPPSTPAGDKIFIAGSHETMGGWKASGAELIKISEYTWRFAARLDKDSEIEFKFTRGDFAKVEKDAKGHEIPNRKLFFNLVAGENKIDCAVEAWADINADGSSAGPKPPEITGDFEFIKKYFGHFFVIMLSGM